MEFKGSKRRGTYDQRKDDTSGSTRKKSIPKIQVVQLNSVNEQNWQTCSCINAHRVWESESAMQIDCHDRI